MERDSKAAGLARRIRELLAEGLELGPDVMHYIDSTYLNPSEEELRALLEDLDGAQNASLGDLVFAPDEAFQARLEPMLAAGTCAAADVEAVRRRLRLEPPVVTLFDPRTGFRVKRRMPGGRVGHFLAQLHIERHADPGVVAALDRFPDEALRTRLKVRLRNAGAAFTGGRNRFLVRFFETVDPGDARLPESLELVLQVLGEGPGDDVYQLLMDKKRNCFRELAAAERFADRLRRSNVETLMMEGVRAPHLDPAEARRRMALVDRIAQRVFGRTEYFESEETAVAVGRFGLPGRRGTP